MARFKSFLINEEQSFLGHKLGGVLTSIHDLEDDMGGMGTRHISKVVEDIVDQIRKILHSQWSTKQQANLKELQKIAVALMKAVEEKDNLKEIIPQISQLLGKISGKLGVKTNSLEASPEPGGADVNPQDMQLTGNGPAPQQPQAQQPGAMPPPPTMQPPMPPI